MPVIYKIQKKIYQENAKIIDDDNFYMQNAISKPHNKPDKTDYIWDVASIGQEKSDYIVSQINNMKKLLSEYNPKIIITFSAFTYEFMRRCHSLPEFEFEHWGAWTLKGEFIEAIDDKKKIIPLLHTSNSSGNFLSSHKQFSNRKLKENKDGNFAAFTAPLQDEIKAHIKVVIEGVIFAVMFAQAGERSFQFINAGSADAKNLRYSF
jgi:hypothetical protein